MLRRVSSTLTVLALTLCSGALFGQVSFNVTNGAGDPGDSASVQVLLDNTADDIQGWSYGVCHDDTNLSLTGATTGTTTTTVKNGDPADFDTINTFSGGATQGVVICFTGCAVLGAGAGYELMTLDYDLTGAPGDYELAFCDSLGTPAVATVYVVAGASLVPGTNSGTMTVNNPNQLSASNETGLIGGSVDVAVTLSTDASAWSAVQCSIQFDDTQLSSTGVSDDTGAEYFQVQAGASNEIIFGLVMEFDGMAPIAAPLNGTDVPVATLSFSVSGTATPGTTPVAFVDGLGSPAIDNLLIDESGFPSSPGTNDGSVELLDFNEFVRSDCNGDGGTDIADGVYLINFLFGGGPDPICDDACDSNDDSSLDVTDAIYVWNYLLLDGPAPLAPFPAAGIDPTPGDGLGCNGDADDV
ncbi:MAG: hypothetical protein AAF488_01175 [Planctomycetota bacterium]